MRSGHNRTKGLRCCAPRNDVAVVMLFVIFITLFSSCRRPSDTFIGRWTVEKVNVEFDEKKATPEMVRQYGELEKDNVIEISKDSVLMFVSDGDTLKGRCLLRGDQLYCDGVAFGQFKEGALTTETSTPLGKVMVIYSKSR